MGNQLKIAKVLFWVSVFFACDPVGPSCVEEPNVFFANYDKANSLASKATFTLPDKVVMVPVENSPGNANDAEYLPSQLANPTLATLRSNRRGIGYTEVTQSDEALLLFGYRYPSQSKRNRYGYV
ncbi:hypothetical protein DDT91_11450 [Algoriphagus sp. AK58]|nr:hypothetical protein [Algoriphagus sp. AK58]